MRLRSRQHSKPPEIGVADGETGIDLLTRLISSLWFPTLLIVVCMAGVAIHHKDLSRRRQRISRSRIRCLENSVRIDRLSLPFCASSRRDMHAVNTHLEELGVRRRAEVAIGASIFAPSASQHRHESLPGTGTHASIITMTKRRKQNDSLNHCTSFAEYQSILTLTILYPSEDKRSIPVAIHTPLHYHFSVTLPLSTNHFHLSPPTNLEQIHSNTTQHNQRHRSELLTSPTSELRQLARAGASAEEAARARHPRSSRHRAEVGRRRSAVLAVLGAPARVLVAFAHDFKRACGDAGVVCVLAWVRGGAGGVGEDGRGDGRRGVRVLARL